jgi:hypothetical protein
MDHKPYESWLVADEPLLPEQALSLQEHLDSCEACRQLQKSWDEVEGIFEERIFILPQPGFTERWQMKLAAELKIETEKQQVRSTWMFLAATTGAAFMVLVIMAIRFFSSLQNSTEVFISSMTFFAGVLNLTATIQKAILPIFEVLLISVPTPWWLLFVAVTSMLVLVLAFSTLRILKTRRVPHE